MTGIEVYAEMVDLAKYSHKEQKYGLHPYYKHLSDVQDNFRVLFTEARKDAEEYYFGLAACAGHDLIEDTNVTEQHLRDIGFPEQVINAIVLVTKVDGVLYEEYIANICKDKLAWQVKVADTYSNLTCSIQDGKTKKVIKYSKQLKLLYEGKDF